MKLNWKGATKTLQNRFSKLAKMSKLSVREELLLTKLISKIKKNPKITLDGLMYHFPGRNFEDLKESKYKLFLESKGWTPNPALQINIRQESKIFEISKMNKRDAAKERKSIMESENNDYQDVSEDEETPVKNEQDNKVSIRTRRLVIID